MSLAKLVTYDALEQYVQQLQLGDTSDWFPFHFEYIDFLYGLVFQPFSVGSFSVESEEELFVLINGCIQTV